MITTQRIVLLFLAAPLASAQLSSGTGVVSLGRTLFEPTCCYACLSSLWSLELSCSTPAGNDVFSINSPKCHASNSPYLTTLAYCMQQKCAIDGVAVTQIEECWDVVAGDGAPVSSYESNLPSSPPTNELSYGALSLNGTMLVNNTYYLESRDTILAYAEQESNHALYSTVVLCSVVGFCVLLGLVFLKEKITPGLQFLPRSLYTVLDRFIFLPALFGKRPSQKLPYNLGYVLPRRTALVIVIYTVLNIVFCAISYPLSSQNTWYLDSSKQQLGYIANRLGVLSIANIALTNGTKFFTNAAALHFLGCTSLYWEIGIIAVIVLVLIVAFSILPIRAHLYEAFVLAHIMLVIIALITLRYHLLLRFNGAYGYEAWLYIAFAVWIFDRFVRISRIIWLNLDMRSSRTPAAKIELLPGNEFIKVTLWPSKSWSVTPGQYCYLHFPTIPLYLESHPFSVASWSNGDDKQPFSSRRRHSNGQIDAGLRDLGLRANTADQGPSHRRFSSPFPSSNKKPSISFIIRPESGLTRRMHSRLIAQQHAISVSVLAEGPYGSMSIAIKEADTVLAFAGGIGITALLGYLTAYLASFPTNIGEPNTLRRTGMRAQSLKIVWAVRESSLVEAFKSQLPDEAVLTQRSVEIVISCREKGDRRLNCGKILRRELQATKRSQRLGILVCGPGRMADEIRGCVVGMKGSDHASVQLVEEAFAW